MNVGVGLPNTTPGTDGELLLDWARRADEGPFSSLAVLDRVLYDSWDSLTAHDAPIMRVGRSLRKA